MADFVQVWVAGELDHRWRSTHQDESVVTGRRKAFPHHVFTDEASAVLPVWNTRKMTQLDFYQECSLMRIPYQRDHRQADHASSFKRDSVKDLGWIIGRNGRRIMWKYLELKCSPEMFLVLHYWTKKSHKEKKRNMNKKY